MAFFKNRKSPPKAPDASGAAPALSLDMMRRRARHRLIGACVLVLLGVAGFPLLFDSQPRPVAVDIAIDIPDKAQVKPLALPAPASSAPAPTAPVVASVAPVPEEQPPAVAEPKAAPPVELTKAPAAVAAEKPLAKPTAPEPKPEAKPAASAAGAKPQASAPAQASKPQAPVDDGAKAAALLEGKDAPAASAAVRYVVQVGAFSDGAKLREVRHKLEKSGLKTYTQVVEGKDGKRTRVRVGPFPSQAEADKSAARIRALELSATVLKM